MSTERRLDRIASTSSNIVPAAAPVRQPEHIVDFAVNFLRLRLFPRQALVLKVVTLATNLMTAYDHKVLNQWMAGFRQITDGDRVLWEGSYGTPGDLMERIETQRSRGAPWFNELLAVFGRRGSKGFLGSVLIAWRVWTMLVMDNPQGHCCVEDGHTAARADLGARGARDEGECPSLGPSRAQRWPPELCSFASNATVPTSVTGVHRLDQRLTVRDLGTLTGCIPNRDRPVREGSVAARV